MTEPSSWRQTKPPVPVFEEKVTQPVVPLVEQLHSVLQGGAGSSDVPPVGRHADTTSSPSSSFEQTRESQEEKAEENESQFVFADGTPAPASPVTMPGSATQAPSSPTQERLDEVEADADVAPTPKSKSKRAMELEAKGFKRNRGGKDHRYFTYWSRPRW